MLIEISVALNKKNLSPQRNSKFDIFNEFNSKNYIYIVYTQVLNSEFGKTFLEKKKKSRRERKKVLFNRSFLI